MINIAIIDDHKLFLHGLKEIINAEEDMTVQNESISAKQFMTAIRKSRTLPDVVITDINMPEINGLELTLWIKENYPTIKILGLSMFSEEHLIIQMYKNGALGFILKDSNYKILIQAIKTVAAGKFYFLNKSFTKDLVKNKIDVELSDREIQFLKYNCNNYTYREIGDLMGVSSRTVENYRDQLFKKLNINNRVALAMYAVKNGIISI